MANEPTKKRLGRGLAALIGEMDQPEPVTNQDTESAIEIPSADQQVSIADIEPNPNNPRRVFGAEELEDLSRSISEHGVVQPILVRPKPNDPGKYELIAGERRWRAAQKAGIHEIPIIVREVDDRQSLELAIIENVQRADLNPLEEAMGYQQLIDEHQYTQADLAKTIGKSRSHVANTLRLMKLPDQVRTMVSEGSLSSGHARALITLDNPIDLARKISAEGLSVRQAEQLAAHWDEAPKKSGSGPAKKEKDADTRALEKKLSDRLGMKVVLDHKDNGKGRMVIDYKSLEQLDQLEKKLG